FQNPRRLSMVMSPPAISPSDSLLRSDTVTRMSTAISPVRLRDPYEFHPEDVVEPPRSFFGIPRRIGPGIILSASIVGSGELIATTTLGAEVGYVAMWIIILSCIIKPAVQSEMGRYIIA